jgi:hypothetical protein
MSKNRQQQNLKGIKLKEFPLTVLTFCVAVVFGAKTAEAATLVTTTVVANGLDNPRGMTFGSDGALYVAEAGRGGPGPAIPGPELGVLLSYGSTGAVTRIQNGTQERIITGLPSLALSPAGVPLPSTTGSEGPAIGPHDIGFNQNGDAYVLTGFASDPNFLGNLGFGGVDMARLLAFSQSADGSWERRTDFTADFATYERLNNPDGEDLVSNPYDLEVQGGNVFVVDAGANDFFRVDNGGNLSLQAVFGSRSLGGIISQSVPTSITIGSDGAYYVGELTGFPFPEGGARIYRVVPGQEPEVYADGFTQINGLDFDSQGNLYVLEYAVDSLSSSNNNLQGALIKVSPDGVRTTLISAGEGLVAPSSLTVSPDDAIYLSNYSTFAGQGEVIRVEPQTGHCPNR